jgi:tetratricopeptide (TPR) repeat protein
VSEFDKHKARIKGLAESGDYDEALTQCNDFLIGGTASRADVLRLRAYVYAHQGRYGEAIADRETIVRSGEGVLRDYYQLGDNLLSAGRYLDASKCFEESLRRGKKEGETWFDSASWLLLSLAQTRMGNLQDAETSLNNAIRIDPECAMPVRGEGLITNQSLKEEIQRKREKLK